MRRSLSVVLFTLGMTIAMSGVASADIGDIQELSVDTSLFGDAGSVEVTGTIDCQTTVEYGLWAGVAQDPDGAEEGTFFKNSRETATDVEEPAEGVGAFGPEFNPPTGISDDSPCSQAVQPYDAVVQQNRDSADFEDGNIEVAVMAGTSAEDGDRGPGPFIGDWLGLDHDVTFQRTR